MNNTKVNNYQVAKENARQKAIDWQYEFSEKSMSWGELAYWQEYFEKLGKKNMDFLQSSGKIVFVEEV